jgi:hypothetical protein
MSVLSVGERKALADVVAEAREVVEAACAQRVAALGVGAERIPDVLIGEQRQLSKALRARARQLGSVEALVTEAGFEHWHRMLFTRYLADNNLLVDDQTGQPVSIGEVAEYAAELGEPDMWEVAARFAAAMLPGIFRQDDPVLAMRLPVETRQRLEDLLGSLPTEVITAEDSLGWVYQYWQARRKDEVNRSERKIGGADLAPVTQLFTENYMVRFLLENSLGAWWAARHPDSPLVADWEYLRYAEAGIPAAGSFEEWPATAAEVTVMDPCCGSGHFLVAAFGMLWRMRAEEERLDVAAAQDVVLRDNLFGLELDPRCTQIAAFALALEAWKSGGYRPLPLPHIACSGIPAKAPLSDWTALADGDPQVEAALTRLHALFVNADTLGSLIDPIRATEQAGLESIDWHTIAPLLTTALSRDTHTADPAAAVFGQAAAGIARAADYLTRTYTLVATNPPWLGKGLQSRELTTFLHATYPEGDAELATSIVIRAEDLGHQGSVLAMVLPQNWTFLASYQGFRERLIRSHDLRLAARLGPGAFSAISGEVVKPVLVVLRLSGIGRSTTVIDLSGKGPATGPILRGSQSVAVPQQQFSVHPNRVITFEPLQQGPPLQRACEVFEGTKPGQTTRVVRRFWEMPRCNGTDWQLLASSPSGQTHFSGMSSIIRSDDYLAAKIPEANRSGMRARGRVGVLMAKIGDLPSARYLGATFDNNTFVVIPRSTDDLVALWVFCESGELTRSARAVNQKLDVSQGTVEGVPFDVDHWRRVAAERYPGGLPEPFSDDPRQWLFKGDPVGSVNPLQVAVARLLGYRWPDQEPDDLNELADSDGVVCLPAVGGEPPAVDRLLQLLARAYGEKWSPAVLDGLLADAGARPGAAGLEAWLRNGFFKDHCKVFANRPFVWQIWDGAPDGFSALVNYHRLDRRLLERLAYDYLGNWWIGRLRNEVSEETPGAEKRLAAAEQLKEKLQLILEGEPPYDIYVRWKALAEQPVGWQPDLDDGVRLNIRPFMTSGVLRHQPNIKWTKDQGKNPDGSERHNDLHYTLAQKRSVGTSRKERYGRVPDDTVGERREHGSSGGVRLDPH